MEGINEECKENCRMKRVGRNILFFIIIAVCFCGNRFGAKAEYKDYEIQNAYFYVQLDANGDACVTEMWKVCYDGEFSRFYKDIYTQNLYQAEQFDQIKVKYAKVNDKSCAWTDNVSARNDFTYSFEEVQNATEMAWYYNTYNGTVEYKVCYTLKNVVKETDDNLAVFAYRFVGENFEKKINNLYISITAPDKTTVTLRNINENKIWKQYENEGSLNLSTKNCGMEYFTESYV